MKENLTDLQSVTFNHSVTPSFENLRYVAFFFFGIHYELLVFRLCT